VRRVVLVLIVIVAASCQRKQRYRSTRQFRYSTQHTGDYSPVAGPVPSNGQLKWSYTTGDWVFSSPAVVNGVVYVGGGGLGIYASGVGSGVRSGVRSGVPSSGDYNVYALNAATGTKLWNFSTGSAVFSSPAVVNGVVYVGSENGKVFALSAATGAKKWSYKTGNAVESSPAVANGVVYVGSGDNNVYALNAATGVKLWNFTTGDYVFSSPAVANGVVYVGSDDGKVYALSAATGAEKWNFTTGSYIESSPAVANGKVYIGSYDDNVYALNAATGAKVWNYTTGGGFSSPAVANGVVYVGGNKVYALDANNGNKLWNYTTAIPYRLSSSPAVANGVVYVGAGGWGIFASGVKSGVASGVKSGVGSIGFGDYNVYALNATTGAKLWNYGTGNGLISSPAVANGVVYVGGLSNVVYAIGNQPTQTRITLTASTTTPAANQPITFTAKLYWWDSVINQWIPVATAGKPVTIYHYVNGVKYTDKTINTDSSGKVIFTRSFGSPGALTYYATFAGDSSYAATTSSVLNVSVKAPIRVTLAASNATPAVNQKVTFNGKLYWWNSATNHWTPVSGKSVTIYHYLNNVRYNDTTKTTNANGQITLTQSFGSAGTRTYYATFAGDASYKASTSAVVTIRVH